MKKVIQISNTLSIEMEKRFKRTIISLIKNGHKEIISSLKTDDYFWSNVVYDENYIVVYSRGCMVNQIPLTIECAYDIKEERMLDLSNKKLKVILEYMYISKRGFELTDVLTFINKEDLQILDEESKGDLKRILTCDNNEITDEEVINYIISKYPNLMLFRNLTGPLSVIEYKKIEELVGQNILRFHLMPQNLKFIEQRDLEEEYSQLKKTRKPRNRRNK